MYQQMEKYLLSTPKAPIYKSTSRKNIEMKKQIKQRQKMKAEKSSQFCLPS